MHEYRSCLQGDAGPVESPDYLLGTRDMPYRVLFGSLLLLLCFTAAAGSLAPAISYTRDIQPIFTEKMRGLSCLLRFRLPVEPGQRRRRGTGASKLSVYDGERRQAADPTRLFYDASGQRAWQRKGFYSVLDAQGSQAALMARMLELGHRTPLQPNAKLPEEIVLGLNRENSCAMPDQFNEYAGAHPKEGMPLAVTGLTDQQYQTLQRWLAAGAPIDQQALAPSAAEALQVVQWENLLNAPGARESLVGRWLFEHWFLAHIYFRDGEPGAFLPVGPFAHAHRPADRPDQYPSSE